MNNNKKLVPKRRFKEFKMATQWYNTNFFSVINNVIDFRGRTPKKLGMSWSDDGYLALSALNVKNGFIDFNVDAHYGDTELYQKWMSGNELKKGQVIFTTEAPMGNVTQIPDDKGYILSQRTIAFETNKLKMTDNFLAITLSSPNVKISLSTIASGGTAKGVSQNSLNSLKINLPESLIEQTQIGEFFKKLDTLIQTQQKKLEKTKTLKSAYLAEMFPADGELKPKRRFVNFKELWQESNIKNLFTITRGKVLALSEISVNQTSLYRYPVYSSQTKNDGLMGYYKEFLFEDAITWTTDGANAGTVNYRQDKFYSTNVNGVLLSNDGLANKAIAESLNKVAWKYVSKVGNPKLMNVEMAKIIILIPTIKEQTKIGNFFKLLDKKIALEQRKLDKLNNIKQAYLNEMFV